MLAASPLFAPVSHPRAVALKHRTCEQAATSHRYPHATADFIAASRMK
jgi:hypothetical protein